MDVLRRTGSDWTWGPLNQPLYKNAAAQLGKVYLSVNSFIVASLAWMSAAGA